MGGKEERAEKTEDLLGDPWLPWSKRGQPFWLLSSSLNKPWEGRAPPAVGWVQSANLCILEQLAGELTRL